MEATKNPVCEAASAGDVEMLKSLVLGEDVLSLYEATSTPLDDDVAIGRLSDDATSQVIEMLKGKVLQAGEAFGRWTEEKFDVNYRRIRVRY